jgi:hypothetical protein
MTSRRKLRTYDAACEELGGRPWLPMPEATDRWFLADALALTPPSLPAIPDTAGFDLKKRMTLTTKLIIVAVALLAAIVVVAVHL